MSFIVDTNCVNAKQTIQEMNKLEGWAESDLFLLLTTEVAQKEMATGNNQQRSARAYEFVSARSMMNCSLECEKLKEIGYVLFPDGVDSVNKSNDVEIVFNAWKYQMHLITNDGASKSQPRGILGSKEQLMYLGISVVTPVEAVKIVEIAIENRDKSAVHWADVTNNSVPEWVGVD